MTNITPLDALGDSTRRKLIDRLRAGPCSVNELVKVVRVSQPAVSQHLRVLKDANLVRVDKVKNQRIYSLDPVGLSKLRSYVDSMWEGVLEAYRSSAENYSQEEGMDSVKSQQTIAPIIKQVKVNIPVEAAFHLFTEKAGSWWPLSSHSVAGDEADTCIVEGWVGGRFYEIVKDRSEHEWGKVIEWEQNKKVVLMFHPGRPVETAGVVEFLFEEVGNGTLITLSHSGWENCGEKAQAMRDGYDKGWDFVLGKFIEKANQ